MIETLFEKGWVQFAPESALRNWAETAREAVLPRVAAPEMQERWLQCEGTWFVGVDCLPNDAQGRVGPSDPLPGAAISMAREVYGDLPLHHAQVSIIYPGYPRPRKDEDATAFNYRLRRDAAHVDGLFLHMPGRRRNLDERHAFILGVPLSKASAGASPLSVWEGSHHLMRRAFAEALKDHPPENWGDVDLSEIYQLTRRQVFETCKRVTLPAEPGSAYLIHRLSLHGVAPWEAEAVASPEGRMIAYFRPQFMDPRQTDWLTRP